MSDDGCPVQWAGQQVVVTLPWHIDSSNASQIREQLLGVINGGAAVVVADLTGTVSCDDSGADALVGAHHRAVANGTQLRLVVIADAVRRVLTRNGLDRLAAVYPDLDGAIAAGAERQEVPGERRTGTADDLTGAGELLNSAVNSIFTVGMMLQEAVDMPSDAAQRITEALRRLDDAVREAQDHVFAGHGQGSQPSEPDLARRPPADLLERSASARNTSALLRQHVARTAHALHVAAADTAALLERRADLLGQPTRIDYPTEIKRWRVFADQARQMAERWEQRPQLSQSRTGPELARIGVFLVDDHEVVRRGVRVLLEAEPDITVVGEAGTASAALARIPAAKPDVAVLDVRLPDGDGVNVCRELRSKMPAVACLILTSFDDKQALIDAIMAGAAGYMLKQIRGADLAAAVRTVASGQASLDPAAASHVMRWMREHGQQQPDPLAGLTWQEKRILTLIGDGLTNRQIAERLILSDKTVKNHVTSLFDKLGMNRRAQAAAFTTRLVLAERAERPRRGG
jgi:two-component system, NarL family, response regulator DevR